MKDIVWNDCMLCSSLWGTCTNASLCKDKGRSSHADGVCVSCKMNGEVGCSLYSVTTESACSAADVKKSVTCAAGYIPLARFCRDDHNFCYVVCRKNKYRKEVIIVCVASTAVLVLFFLVLLFGK